MMAMIQRFGGTVSKWKCGSKTYPPRLRIQRRAARQELSHGTWLGEPLHVILTDVPIGAWTAAVVFDALDSSPRRQYSIAADTAVAVGLAGAVGAAATGLTDWQDIDPPSTAHRSSTWIAQCS